MLGDFTNPVDLMILVGLALVVFGPNRLVEMSRKLGPTLHELRTMNQQLREQAGLDEATRALQDIRSGLSFSTPPDAAATPREAAVEPSATTPAGADERSAVTEQRNDAEVVFPQCDGKDMGASDAPQKTAPPGQETPVESFGRLKRSLTRSQ